VAEDIFVPDPRYAEPAPTPEQVDAEQSKTPEQEFRDLLAEARQRFQIAEEAIAMQHQLARDDLDFKAGKQWPEQIKIARESENRPCLVINRMPQFVRQVTNDMRQNRPSVRVSPVDSDADPEVAEVLEGLIRHIESVSNADIAYDHAFEFMAITGGPAYIRVDLEYPSEESFSQEIRINKVPNHFSVFMGPHAQDPTGADAEWVIAVIDMSKDEFKRRFPNAETASLQTFDSIGNKFPGWATSDTIRVAEYWYKEPETKVIVRLDDGTIMSEDDLDETTSGRVIDRRKVTKQRVKWVLMSANEILDRGDDYPGKYIPIVRVVGEEYILDNHKLYGGVIRFAKDAQRAYNYWTSAETEAIALAPKAPFIAEAGQIEGFENIWRNLNRKNYAVLPYRGVAINDQLVPPPTRLQAEPPIQAISLAKMQAADDMKATTGIFDAALGARSNEVSGRAILARQRESDVANFHLMDNFARSIRQVGRIIIDLIPYVYDVPKVVRILGQDYQPKAVAVQSSVGMGTQPPEKPVISEGIQKIYDVGVGTYDVVVSTGPSYTTKRQEAVEAMLQLTQNYPPLLQVVGDLLISNMDWPGAHEIAARLKKMVPPELVETGDKKQPPAIPPQVQQQIQVLMQQHEQLTQLVNRLLDERDKRILEIASKERIAAMQVQAEMIMTQAKLQAQLGIEQLQRGIEEINQRLEELARIERQVGMQPEEAQPVPAEFTGQAAETPVGGSPPAGFVG